MASTSTRRSSYGIFVRFRQSRLALRRGITRLEDALAIAAELRASRFHDRGDIFVVKEPEGVIIDPSMAAPSPLVVPVVAPASSASSHDRSKRSAERSVRVPAHENAGDAHATPKATRTYTARVEATRRGETYEAAFLARLVHQVEHMRRTLERARTARARFERAYEAAEGALQSRGLTTDAIHRNHQRLGAVRDSARRSAASFARVAALMEERLEIARTSAERVASR